MPVRVIFLDIDGPMIPLRSLINNRNGCWNQDLDDACLKVLRHVIDDTGAVIAFNTTHSSCLLPFKDPLGDHPGLLARFAERGFELGREIHRSCATRYPEIPRLPAIRAWLSENQADEWVAFDDAVIADDRAILVSYEHGIGWHEYWHARKWFLGDEPKIVLM